MSAPTHARRWAATPAAFAYAAAALLLAAPLLAHACVGPSTDR